MKTHKKTFILMLILCILFTMVPCLAFAEQDTLDASEQPQESEEIPESVKEEAQGETAESAEKTAEAKEPGDKADEGPQLSETEESSTDGVKEDDTEQGAETDGQSKESQEQTHAEESEKITSEETALICVEEESEVTKLQALNTADNSSVSYTAKRNPTSNDVQFTAKINGVTYTGTCCELGVKFRSSGTAKITALGKNHLCRKVAYKYKSWQGNDTRNYDMGGVYKGACLESMMQYAMAWEKDKAEGSGVTTNRDKVTAHMKKSSANGGNGWNATTVNKITAAVKALNKQTADVLGIPGKFRAYWGKITNTKSGDTISGQDALFWGDLVTGTGTVKKVPDPDVAAYVAAHPGDFNLAGAKYQLYTNSACTTKAKDVNWNNAILTTKADGTSNTLTLEIGTYYAKEISAAKKGYGIAVNASTGKAKVYTVKITKGNKTTFTSEEPIKVGPEVYGIPEFRVYKTDTAGTADWERIGAAGFTVKFFGVTDKDDISLDDPDDWWTFKTKKKAAPSDALEGAYWSGFDWKSDKPVSKSGDFYHPSDLDPTSTDSSTRVLPVGWFTIEETDPPAGYYPSTDVYYGWIDKKGNVHYEDKNADSQSKAQVFIMRDKPKENKVYKTDSVSGENLAGAELAVIDSNGTVKETWTTGDEPHVLSDLEDGTYTLQEIKAPYGCEIADDVTFTVESGSVTGVQTGEDGGIIMEDPPVTVETTAVSASTNRQAGARKAGEVITDTVTMTGLIAGRSYKLEGVLMSKLKETAVSGTAQTKNFTATDETMEVPVDFTFDATEIEDGDSVVVFETLYRTTLLHDETSPVELGKHQDINDTAQTVVYPGISTTAALRNDNTEVEDVIEYKDLLPDTDYVFKGWLVDTATGEKVPDSDGRTEINTGTETSGKVTVTLKTEKYDDMTGHRLTAFEELYIVESEDGEKKEILAAEHKDTEDSAQTVEIYHDLKVRKNVTGNLGDLSKVFEYTAEFTGLVPGEAYTIKGDDEKTFVADPDGNASVPIKLMDDQEALIKKLPKGATYVITEAASDHVAGFKVFSEEMEKKGAKITVRKASNGAEASKILSTAKETVDLFDGTIVVVWENNRDLATLTGLAGPDYTVYTASLAGIFLGLVLIMKKRKI